MNQKKGYNLTTKSVFNLGLGLMERLLCSRYLNIWKTAYINFRCLPFSQAVRFPIIVWGGVTISSLMGKIEINAPIKCGMIKLGVRWRYELSSCSKSFLHNSGKIIFNGAAEFFNGYMITTAKNGVINIGRNVFCNSNVVSIAHNDYIRIGNETRIGIGTRIVTNDSHYIIDTNSLEVRNNHSSITIGANCWLTGDVKVMKGVVLPDWTIVTANSILNRDYTKSISENSIIGGQPAKLIKEGQRRIFSLTSEAELNQYFADMSAGAKFTLGKDVNLDSYCRR